MLRFGVVLVKGGCAGMAVAGRSSGLKTLRNTANEKKNARQLPKRLVIGSVKFDSARGLSRARLADFPQSSAISSEDFLFHREGSHDYP